MGRPKQLLDLAGKPLLQHVLDAAASAPLDEIVLVLGHAAHDVAAAIDLPPRARKVVAPDHDHGQAASLRAGLAAAHPASRAAVVMLGDQPALRADAVAAVVGAFAHGGVAIVRAAYGGHPSHPTLLSRSLWPELASLTGDEGARGLFPLHSEPPLLVEVGGSPPLDVDTPDDYLRARALIERG